MLAGLHHHGRFFDAICCHSEVVGHTLHGGFGTWVSWTWVNEWRAKCERAWWYRGVSVSCTRCCRSKEDRSRSINGYQYDVRWCAFLCLLICLPAAAAFTNIHQLLQAGVWIRMGNAPNITAAQQKVVEASLKLLQRHLCGFCGLTEGALPLTKPWSFIFFQILNLISHDISDQRRRCQTWW